MAQEEMNKISEEMNEMDELSVDELESISGGVDFSRFNEIFESTNPTLNKRATLGLYLHQYTHKMRHGPFSSSQEKNDVILTVNYLRGLIKQLP